MASALDIGDDPAWKNYPTTHDSGVEWIEEVPTHWRVKRLGLALTSVIGGGTPDTSREDFWSDEGDHSLAWVAIGDMSEGGSMLGTEKRVTRAGMLAATLRTLPVGTIIYSMYASVGAVARLGIPASTKQAILGLIPSGALTSSFLYWWLHAIRQPVLSLTRDNTQSNLNAETVRGFPLCFPPLDEQRDIAAYLDRETERIDSLIAKKRLLIERLQEYRTALITRTVTRGLPPKAASAAGLDPSPRLKPSGVEWLGDIPKHWGIESFSREVDIAEGQVDPENEPYASMVLVAPNHIESGTGRLMETQTATEQAASSGKYLCRQGEILYSKIRPALAKVALAPTDCLCSADMYPMRPRRSLTSDFLYWLLLSKGFTAWSVLEAERVAMPKINRETLNTLRLPIPPIAEQHALTGFLRHKSARLDALQGRIGEAVDRLQEYRTALITAAATGKIDVRDEVSLTADLAE